MPVPVVDAPTYEWPPPRGTIGSPVRTANRTASTTSAGPAHRTIAGGRIPSNRGENSCRVGS